MGDADRGQPRHQARPRGPRRRPLRPREGQGPDPRVPRGAHAEAGLRSGPILCFVGPPGVGKTSLGKSIARALGREFERISVGGVRDEAEIRGHRRTYIGAMPGTIVRALRDAGSRNPVFMIDEIDKMGADFRGDPSSAMLEVLDPAQNDSFRDHYLDVPFDLSEVIFIATANSLDTIPGPLRDRMEVIQLSGYTLDEKLHIAKRYLVPRQIEANGLKRGADRVLRRGAAGDRRGVHPRGGRAQPRARDRHRLPQGRPRGRRGAARRRQGHSVSAKRARELLGRRRVLRRDSAGGPRDPGVATGLAWTPVGGEVLFIEATAMPGSGRLTITGQLGDVMKESAQAALSWVRGHAERGRARARRRLVRRARHPHPRPGRRGAEGRPLGRRRDDGRSELARLRAAGARRRRDDRRDDADRPGPADRRPQGEVARRAAGRDQARDRAGPQRGRGRSRSRSTSAASSSSSTSTESRRRSTPRSNNNRHAGR